MPAMQAVLLFAQVLEIARQGWMQTRGEMHMRVGAESSVTVTNFAISCRMQASFTNLADDSVLGGRSAGGDHGVDVIFGSLAVLPVESRDVRIAIARQTLQRAGVMWHSRCPKGGPSWACSWRPSWHPGDTKGPCQKQR